MAKRLKKNIPYGHQSIDQSDIKAVSAVLKSDWLTQGPKTVAFQSALAEYVGAKYAVAVSSGTAALHVAYLAAGLKAGDEVITTPNTFVATTNMLLAVGAKPVFCDIKIDSYNIDERKIEQLITKKTRAIVPVHIAGRPCDMGKIMAIARKYNLIVIEDACHALGAEYRGKKIGGLSSLGTVFSFHPVKTITTGEGGAVVTNDQELYEKALLVRSHGIVKDQWGFQMMNIFGWNYRLSDIGAALGFSQIKKVDRFVKKRASIAGHYEKQLKKIEEIILPTVDGQDLSAWHIYVIRTKEPKDRLPLYRFLKENGVGVNLHYPTVYSHQYYRQNGFGSVSCRMADLYAATAITLPCYPDLTEAEIKFASDLIKSYFKRLSVR
jgi:UDP-4-amino-4,6-dideoxy-N-acetyl-beta-L-altrosamine transaminase